MKLKQLVFNSLPRPRSKQKKKQEKQEKQQQQQQQQQQQRQQQKSGVQPQILNNALPPPVLEVRNADHVVTRATNVDVSSRNSTNAAITVHNKSLVTDDFRYIGEKLSPVSNDIFNVNFNVNAGDAKCACYKHINPLQPTPVDLKCGRDARYFSFPVTGDNNFNSLPRTRTRIKTNPWLPSPRSTPSQTPDTSPMTSSTPSPTYSDRRSFDSECGQLKEEEGQYEEISNLNIAVTDTAEKVPYSQSERSIDNESLLQRKSVLSETDNGDVQSSVTSSPVTKATRPSFLPVFVDDSCTTSSCDDDVDTMEGVTEPKLLETQVSFEYEEAFESQVEATGVGQYVSSRDNLSDVSSDDIFKDPLGSRAHDFDSEYCPSNYGSSCNTSTTETDDTLCDENYPSVGRRRSRRPYRYDIFHDYYNVYDSGESNKENGHVKLVRGYCDKNTYDSLDSAVGTASPDDSFVKNDHTVGHARLSLQDKVNRLRQEKIIVDEKIRQAQEEERIRMQEKMKFQKQMTLHRKQLLLRTLQDLKSKLENQSQRLQETYSAVLTMQQTVMVQRRQNLRHRRPAAVADTREAPF